MNVWRSLLIFNSRLFAVLDAELLAEHGLSLAEYEVLNYLSQAPDHALRMSELAEAVLVSRSGLTRRVDHMVSAGLVAKRNCPSDKRGTFAELTQSGLAKLGDAARTHIQGVRAYFIDNLSQVQLECLSKVLDTLNQP